MYFAWILLSPQLHADFCDLYSFLQFSVRTIIEKDGKKYVHYRINTHDNYNVLFSFSVILMSIHSYYVIATVFILALFLQPTWQRAYNCFE